jgi:hypothetical protein
MHEVAASIAVAAIGLSWPLLTSWLAASTRTGREAHRRAIDNRVLWQFPHPCGPRNEYGQ